MKAEAGAQRILRLESEMNELYVLANHLNPFATQTDSDLAQGERERKGPIRAHVSEAKSEDA